MTHDQFEVLSNQAVAACAVVYFLAVLAHLAQWAAGRKVARAGRRAPRCAVGVAVGGRRARPPAAEAVAAEEPERMELFGRIGVALTVVAAFVHFIARGQRAGSPRTRCGCPGATCTSSP